MAYLVFNNNGSLLVRIPTRTIDTSTTSLTLIGRDVTNFGTFYNQNLITAFIIFKIFFLYSLITMIFIIYFTLYKNKKF